MSSSKKYIYILPVKKKLNKANYNLNGRDYTEARLLALKLVLKIIYFYFHNQQTKKTKSKHKKPKLILHIIIYTFRVKYLLYIYYKPNLSDGLL